MPSLKQRPGLQARILLDLIRRIRESHGLHLHYNHIPCECSFEQKSLFDYVASALFHNTATFLHFIHQRAH